MTSDCSSFGYSKNGNNKDKWHQWWSSPSASAMKKEESSSVSMERSHESKRIKMFDHQLVGQRLMPKESSAFLSTQGMEFLTNEGFSCMNQQSRNSSIELPHSSSRTLPFCHDQTDELRPLGLTLRKSQSLVDLIQKNLEEENNASLNAKNGAEDNEKNKGSALGDNQQDKLKASNFPAAYLKIGKWERSSVYEGDLVAKCYYAKRKLVWEVLDNGLKSKIEIQWSDITGLRANMPEKGIATLHVEVSRTPLFYRETNPQPRKHTNWQPTSDFTVGQASICRRHLLQFTEGVLNRHFEKLVQCDPRLKSLSEQSIPFSGSPFFEGRILMLDLQQNTQMLYPADMSSTPTYGSLQSTLVFPFSQEPEPVIKQSIFPAMEQEQRESLKPQAFSPSSVIDSRANDESSNSDTEDLYAREFGRHASYKKTGTSILYDQSLWSSNRLVSSTMDPSSSNVACLNLPSKTIDFNDNIASTPGNEQNLIQRLSHHLLNEDCMPEKVFPQNAEAKPQSKSFSGHTRMVDNRTLGYPSTSLEFCMNNLGFSNTVKEEVEEERKCKELDFKSVKMEDYVSCQLKGNAFAISKTDDISQQEAFPLPHQLVSRVPHFF